MPKRLLIVFVLVLLLGLPAPAGAKSKGFVEEEFPYGYFYGTFGESPNVLLLAGGTAEGFCPDGFDGTPGTTTSRTFVRQDGSVDVKVNDRGQPIHLYKIVSDDAEAWITDVCEDIEDGDPAPVPFASGTVNLKVRDSYVSDPGPPERLFNSVNGKATGTDGTEYEGTEYRVRAAADIPFEDGAPVGFPPDWVSFELREIGR